MLNIKKLFISTSVCFAVLASASHAEIIVDDDFANDGTVTTDASYFGSSASSAIEFNTNSIGLVSGTSGRQIHALFETQTLAEAGDSLKATIVFSTPATVSPTGDDLRIGLFDHLEQTSADELGQNTSYSSSSPNELFSDLSGFYLEIDIENADPATDFDVRTSDPSVSGRLLATSDGFTALGSGPDVGYVIDPNSQYTVTLTLTRTESGTLEIQTDLGDDTHTSIDEAPSFSFGMLAMGASSGGLGSTNEASDDPNIVNDNGIDIDSFTVEFLPINGEEEEEEIEEVVEEVVEEIEDAIDEASGGGGGSFPIVMSLMGLLLFFRKQGISLFKKS